MCKRVSKHIALLAGTSPQRAICQTDGSISAGLALLRCGADKNHRCWHSAADCFPWSKEMLQYGQHRAERASFGLPLLNTLRRKELLR